MPLKRFQMSLGNEKHMVLRWWISVVSSQLQWNLPIWRGEGMNQAISVAFFQGIHWCVFKKNITHSRAKASPCFNYLNIWFPQKTFHWFRIFPGNLRDPCFRQEPFQPTTKLVLKTSQEMRHLHAFAICVSWTFQKIPRCQVVWNFGERYFNQSFYFWMSRLLLNSHTLPSICRPLT